MNALLCLPSLTVAFDGTGWYEMGGRDAEGRAVVYRDGDFGDWTNEDGSPVQSLTPPLDSFRWIDSLNFHPTSRAAITIERDGNILIQTALMPGAHWMWDAPPGHELAA